MDLTVVPEEIHILQQFRTHRAPAESGMIHRRSAWEPWGGELRAWILLWQNATVAEKDSLSQLWASTCGGALSMNWTPPGEASAVVRFIDGSFAWDLVTASRVAMQVTIEEVR